MGYLIEQGLIKRETFFIDSGSVQFMDATQPYQLRRISDSYYIPIAANVTLDNATYVGPYVGWTHLHLSLNDTTFAIPAIFATIAVNAVITNALERNFNYQFIMNFQTSPNRFGSNILEDNDLYIWWDTLPTGGDSGMYVDIYYVNQTFR
jgi:hypothetical protein